MAKMASGKTLLLFKVILFLMACVLEARERQVTRLKNGGIQRQDQDEITILLKHLEERVYRLETLQRLGLPGRPGRPGPKGDRGSGGVQYVRWGRTTCPWSSFLVYKGRIGGEGYSHSGGGSNYVCLPENPRYRRYKYGDQGAAYMYGTEYSLFKYNPFTRNLHDHEAPCAVCYVGTRSAKIMIPATYVCPAGWRREYQGYLMSEKWNHGHSSNFICVDEYAEAVPGTRRNSNGALLSPVEGVCGSLPCYPYVEGRELTCAVCTK